jgi:hypothetical protein
MSADENRNPSALLSFAAGFVAGIFSLWYYFMRKGALG